MSLIPLPLRDNSTIGLICPAGGFDDYKAINKAVKYLKEKGYKIKLGKSLITHKYLSGPNQKRLSDLTTFFKDKKIDAIFCLRGGYGSLRLLNEIDFKIIKNNKKILIGFSDITVLLLSIFKKTKLITFHGPMPGIRNNSISLSKMWKLLTNKNFSFSYENKPKGIVIKKGKAAGTLLGGNLTNICSMIGSGFLPDFKDSILFLEDCNEEPYKIDRLLTQLINAKIFKKVKGIIFSSFYNCKFKNQKEIVELIKDKTTGLKIPVIYNFPIGHGRNNFTVPVGVRVMLDADNVMLKSM